MREALQQRVLNDLERTRLYYGRMIRPLAHPPSPLFRQQLVSLSYSSWVSLIELTADEVGGRDSREGGVRGSESRIIHPPESLALCKSFNTLCTTEFCGNFIYLCRVGPFRAWNTADKTWQTDWNLRVECFNKTLDCCDKVFNINMYRRI
jgi:hypothetical protein